MEEGMIIFKNNFSKEDITEGKARQAILTALDKHQNLSNLLFNAAQATLGLHPPFLDDRERTQEERQKLLEQDGYTVIVSVGHMNDTKELKEEVWKCRPFAEIAQAALETWVNEDEWKTRQLTFGAPTTSRS